MGKNTKIAWATHTHNPWIGCTKVSPGCANCYAEVDGATVKSDVKWGVGQPRLRTTPANWNKPLAWNTSAKAAGERHRVFCASLSDWLDDEVPVEWLADLLLLIQSTPDLDWLLLSKRPENWQKRLEAVRDHGGMTGLAVTWLAGCAPKNVWVGTTVEDQRRAHERLPHLIRIPAVIRFISMEPLLEEVNLFPFLPCEESTPRNCSKGLQNCSACPAYNCGDNTTPRLIDWVIIGGESGDHARSFQLNWVRRLLHQCRFNGIPCFIKQLGARPTQSDEEVSLSIGQFPVDVGPRGRLQRPIVLNHRKGGDMAEWPEDLRVQEFPCQ